MSEYNTYNANWGRSRKGHSDASRAPLGIASLSATTEKIYSSFSTDPAYGKVRALLHMERLNLSNTDPISAVEVYDDSYKAETYYRSGGAALSTAQKKFGSSSLLLDGTNDYVYRDNVVEEDFFLNDYNWCWECWFYPTAIGRTHSLINQSNGNAASNSSALVYIGSDNNIGIYTTENTGWDNYAVSTGGELSAANQWYHIAGVRYNDHSGSDTLKIYINGQSYASTDMTGKTIPASTRDFQIGTQAESNYAAGYIDDVRVTIGNARYTANFAPPTEAHNGESRYQQTVITGISGDGATITLV